MKTFTYHVNGTDFVDTEAFGKAWQDAKELATELHCGITRTVTDIKEEFYARGAFLNQQYYDKNKEWIF